MNKVKISVFKARCLQILDEVSRTGKELVITRHGKEIAVISPAKPSKSRNGFGIAKGTIEIVGDIVEPVADAQDWEVLN